MPTTGCTRQRGQPYSCQVAKKKSPVHQHRGAYSADTLALDSIQTYVLPELETYGGGHKPLWATASQIACGLSILTILVALSNLARAIKVSSYRELNLMWH